LLPERFGKVSFGTKQKIVGGFHRYRSKVFNPQYVNKMGRCFVEKSAEKAGLMMIKIKPYLSTKLFLKELF
jgi:hypothetical protein